MKFFWLTLVAVLLSVGQILFKKSAVVASGENFLLGLVNFWMFLALLIYGFSTVLWVWLLKDIPLSTAYPFAALAFVLVPIGSVFLFGEVLSVRYLVGCTMILGGIILTAT